MHPKASACGSKFFSRAPAGVLAGLSLSALLLTGCNSGDSNSSRQSQQNTPEPISEWAADHNVPTLFLTFSPSDLEDLYARSPYSDDRVSASYRFSLDEPETDLHGLRFRGSSSRILPKKSFNIRFNDPQELLFGSTRMNANGMYTDGSMMRERLAMNMFHHLQRPAPRTAYLDMTINGNYEGLYIHIERVDEVLLSHAGLNPNGTLVRDNFRFTQNVASAFGFVLSPLPVPDQQELIAASFDSRGNPDWAALTELILWMEGSRPGELFAQEFAERFDLEVFTDWLAIHYLIGDIDSFGNDYWLYLDHEDPDARWHVIPWDKDLSFGSHHRDGLGVINDFFSYEYPVTSYWNNGLIELYLQTPELRTALRDRIADLMKNEFTADYFREQIESTHELIAPSVATGPSENAFLIHPQNHHSDQGIPLLQNETLLDFVQLRYAFLQNWLEPGTGPAYEAQVEISADARSEPIFFTDSNGWTIGMLRPLSTPSAQGTLTLSVSQDASIPGVDRVWRLHNTASDFDAELTLFYRNDIPQAGTDMNWFAEEWVALGGQWNLGIAEKFGNQFQRIEGGRVNALSNKVQSGALTINYGWQEFVITDTPSGSAVE